MFKSVTKKLVLLALAIGTSAAFAYPPQSYFCHKLCIKEGPVGSPVYEECMDACI
ncbi:hypothetical protein ACO0LF_06515 [Undibacterium sp. Di27W]|uniref:hypothetical protein n=1 Tax=Undibacterium sp. Di27W TaxID=3413036 RepID=UPI003BF2BDAD